MNGTRWAVLAALAVVALSFYGLIATVVGWG